MREQGQSDKEYLNKLIKTGTTLDNYGINNFGLDKKLCLEVLQELKRLSIPVLGGDVLKCEDERWVHTYDNWYCNKLPQESTSNFAIRANGIAEQYVTSYAYYKKGETLFVLTFLNAD